MLLALGLAAALGVVAVAGLVVVLALQDDDPGLAERTEPTEDDELTEDDEPAGIDQSALVLGDRCGLRPGTAWTRLDDSDFIANFSALADEPLIEAPQGGDPGIYLEVRCSPKDGLTPLGNEFGIQDRLAAGEGVQVEVIEQAEVEISGERGIVSMLRFGTVGDVPRLDVLQTAVDIGNSRCSMKAVGSEGRIDEVRSEFDAVVDTLICQSSSE